MPAAPTPYTAETADLSEQIRAPKFRVIKGPNCGPYFHSDKKRLYSKNYFDVNGEIIMLESPPSTEQIFSLRQTGTPVYYFDNYRKLMSSFEIEIQGGLSEKVFEMMAEATFNQLATSFSQLPFEDCAVEVTKSKSIKLSLTFPGEKLLIVSKPFEAIEDVSEKEIIFSLFINRELIASDVLENSEFVEGFKRFLSL